MCRIVLTSAGSRPQPGGLFGTMIAITKKRGSEELKDVLFLVRSQPHTTGTVLPDLGETWEKTMKNWNVIVDMQYIAEGGLEVLIDSQITL